MVMNSMVLKQQKTYRNILTKRLTKLANENTISLASKQ